MNDDLHGEHSLAKRKIPEMGGVRRTMKPAIPANTYLFDVKRAMLVVVVVVVVFKELLS